MKKVLLSGFVLGTLMLYGQAQVLIDENFNSLTVGTVGTPGAVPGQGSMYMSGGTSADYQIAVIDAAHANSLTIISGNGAPPATGSNTNNRFIWKDITTTAAPANDIVMMTFDIYTGPATGAGFIKGVLFDGTGTIGGLKYNYATKVLQGEARVNVQTTPPQTGTLTLNLPGGYTFPANTWVTVQYRYNKTSGAHQYLFTDGVNNSGGTYTGGNVTVGGATYPASVITGLVPLDSDFVSETAAGNTVANQASVDNWNVQFTNNATLGTVETGEAHPSSILSVYPNPTTDILNIKTDGKVKGVMVFDASGRIMNTSFNNNQVDVKSLESGAYIIRVETEKGISSEKFIKK